MFRLSLISEYDETLNKQRDQLLKAIDGSTKILVSPLIKFNTPCGDLGSIQLSIGDHNEDDLQLSIYAELDVFGKPKISDTDEEYVDVFTKMYADPSDLD